MVTELMGGGDVEAIVEDAPEHRLPMEQAISIAVETCRGLEFAHSKGIVHRDLKPGNVWLTADGIAKIGDFGLAVATDRSRLTQEGMMVGTVSYMPPEQAMGGEVTPRADLYSLGAMLYEMVCGRPPFLGDDSVAIIGQHINTPPVAPTWHRSDCPRPLDALIMRLLAKDPSERPDSASDVLAALEAVDTSSSEQSVIEPGQSVNVLDSLAGDVFVGRQREMDQLKAALEDALGGRGRMVTLVGEPGIGKTRTAQELATYAGLRGAQVLWGRCYEEQGVPPYWPWVQAIRGYVRERDPERLSSEMGSGAAAIAEIVSDIREKLPGLPKPPQFDDPKSARFRLFDSITAFLRTASQHQPLVLVLGDLHWSDRPSLMLMQFLVRELSGARLLLIGTYRDMELNRRHPLAEALGDLTRERLFERVLLRGLDHADVGRFVEMATGISPPAGLVDAVHTQTEGNPLFVTEVVRLLVQEGELGSDGAAERDSWEVRIPEGVREVIGRRLNRLLARCNEVLTVASVVGREFELRHVDKLVEDLTEDMLLDVLEEGLGARVIEELPSAVGRYQFTHALIQETLTSELSLTRRVRLHARIAATLEDVYGANAAHHAAELAHHFAQAEAMPGPEKMIEYAILAGERAFATHAYEQALAHFERALAAKEEGPMDGDTADVLFGLGLAQAATIERSQAQEARDLIERAFDYYVEVGDAIRAVAVAQQPVGITAWITGRAEVVSRALELVTPDSLDAARLLSQYGFSLGFETGDHERVEEAFGRAISIAQREGETALEARTLAYSGFLGASLMDYEGSLERSLSAIELTRRSSDLQAEVRARMAAAASLIATGELDEARLHSTAFMEVAESLRDRLWLAHAAWVLGTLSRLEGDWQAAQGFFDRAITTLSDHHIAPRGKRWRTTRWASSRRGPRTSTRSGRRSVLAPCQRVMVLSWH